MGAKPLFPTQAFSRNDPGADARHLRIDVSLRWISANDAVLAGYGGWQEEGRLTI
jgi:hypothetical protein